VDNGVCVWLVNVEWVVTENLLDVACLHNELKAITRFECLHVAIASNLGPSRSHHSTREGLLASKFFYESSVL